MKRLLTLITLCAASHMAQAQNTMNIYQNNGTVITLPLSTIDSITFASPPPSMMVWQTGGGSLSIVLSGVDSITYTIANLGNLASLTTMSIGGIATSSATSGGNISDDGGTAVTQRGVVWSTSTNPTTANNSTNNGSGTGSFTSNLTGLTANTTYFVRAYATNSAGTAYGNQLSFNTTGGTGVISSLLCYYSTISGTLTEGMPASGVSSSVTYTGGNGGTHNGQTVNSTGVTGLIATLAPGSFATGNGGVTYSITGTPSGSGTASFALNIGGQSCNLTVMVISSSPLNPNLTYGSITDQDGNTYATIVIGEQEWMAENLRTTLYANGDAIPNVTLGGYSQFSWGQTVTGAWAHYHNNSQYDYPYGKLYNFFAVHDSRNICPSGWHVPSDAEWNVLIGFLDPGFNPNAQGVQSNTVGNKMKSVGTLYWQNPNSNATNESGFSGVGGGSRNSEGDFSGISVEGRWWSATVNLPYGSYIRTFGYFDGRVYRFNDASGGMSVRCVKDIISSLDCSSAINSGTLIQGTAASGVSSSVPYTGGNGGSHNGQTINSTDVLGLTATLSPGTLSNGSGTLTYTITGTTSNTPAGHGTASFALSIGGETCVLQLEVINASCGSTNIHNPLLTNGTMTDQEGTVYKTIVIGTQEWMAENLKTSSYRNGELIPNITNAAEWSGLNQTETGAWVNLNNNGSEYDCPYGKLYNHYAVTDSRNLCPVGWHVPTDEEWYTMESFLDPTVNDPNAIGYIGTNVGGKMKSTGTTGAGIGLWAGSNLGANNESGFSGLPGGRRWQVGDFDSPGGLGSWWSASINGYSAWCHQLFNSDSRAIRNSEPRTHGLSVRCVRD